MPALATTPQQTQALMTDFLKASSTSGRNGTSGKKSKSARQSLASAANQTLPSPVPPQYAYSQPQPQYYSSTTYDEFATHRPIQVYQPHPYMMTQRPSIPYPYNSPGQVDAYGPPMEPSLSNESIMSMQHQLQYQHQPQTAQLDPAHSVKSKRVYTKKAASWKENGGAGRGRNKGKAPATNAPEPLMSSGSASASGSGSVISDQFSPVLDQPPLIQTTKRRAVPVTDSGPEGRKLNLASPVDDTFEDSVSIESLAETLEPRLTTIPSIQTDGDGVASLATAEVVRSEMSWLESARSIPLPSTPGATAPASPLETKEVKTKRRLEAFSTDPSSSISPTKKSRSPTSSGSALISTRVEMFGRVALGKEAAVRWLGLQATAAAVEETQSMEDAAEEDWIQAQSSSSSPRLLRPDWPDAHGPWVNASAESLDIAKESAERKLLLTKYLETESEEDEEYATHVYGRTVPSGRGKTTHDLVHRSPSPSPSRGLPRLNADSADARSAFALAHRNRPIRSVGPYIACLCGSRDDAPPLQSCEGCNSFHHAECVGLEVGETYLCRPCERKAVNASGGLATPPPSSEPRLVATADPTRIYRSDLQSLALAPSPMFGGERRTPGQFRTPRIPSSAARHRTPGSPSSAHRSRILSYGEDDYAPSTPAARNVSHGSHQPSTPRFEDLLNAQDDHPFDVTSTPSRHLDFTPAQQFLFQTPTGSRARVISSTGQAMSFATPSQDFLKELHNESTPALSHLASADSMAYPLSPYTASGSTSIARMPSSMLNNQQHSPSPYGHRRRVSSGNKVSFAPASSSVRLSSRLGFGAAFDEDDELEGQSVGKRYQGLGVGGLEGSSMR